MSPDVVSSPACCFSAQSVFASVVSMDPELIDLLRVDLDAAGYSRDAVAALWGSDAESARLRGVFAPARRALAQAGSSPLATLARVFLLGDSVARAGLGTALPGLGADGAIQMGLVAEPLEDPGSLRAVVSLNSEVTGSGEAHGEWWILSDLDDQLRLGPARSDHVMGVGGATRSLIAQAPPREVTSSLDLGTGCGIVALHLTGVTSGQVVATDISDRALMFAQANARLNRVDHRIDFRRGDLLEPVRGEEFDLILSNPPFVITPRGPDEPVYEYRDGGLVGDALIERVVREAPQLLAVGGTLLCLGNWESREGEDGLERVRGWVGGMTGWAIERDRVDPVQYAETWARDGGARAGSREFERLMTGWILDFEARGVVEVGLGSIRVQKTPGPLRLEQATGPLGPGLGEALQDAFEEGVACARLTDDQVLATCWVRSPAVTEIREHHPGEEAPRGINLVSERGIYRRIHADTLLAAAVGACDGELTLSQIADALATILELDGAEVSAALLAGVRELVWLGMLASDSNGAGR